jgi:hypothetical protein
MRTNNRRSCPERLRRSAAWTWLPSQLSIATCLPSLTMGKSTSETRCALNFRLGTVTLRLWRANPSSRDQAPGASRGCVACGFAALHRGVITCAQSRKLARSTPGVEESTAVLDTATLRMSLSPGASMSYGRMALSWWVRLLEPLIHWWRAMTGACMVLGRWVHSVQAPSQRFWFRTRKATAKGPTRPIWKFLPPDGSPLSTVASGCRC